MYFGITGNVIVLFMNVEFISWKALQGNVQAVSIWEYTNVVLESNSTSCGWFHFFFQLHSWWNKRCGLNLIFQAFAAIPYGLRQVVDVIILLLRTYFAVEMK